MLLLLLAAAAVIGVPAVLSYAGVRAKSTRRDRWVLGCVASIAALVVLLACLFRPMLLLSAAVPQRNYVGVLIDDSRSMRIADRDGQAAQRLGSSTRSAAPIARCSSRCGRNSRCACSAFRPGAQRVDSAAGLTFDAGETHVADAVEQARQELDAVPLSGLVV